MLHHAIENALHFDVEQVVANRDGYVGGSELVGADDFDIGDLNNGILLRGESGASTSSEKKMSRSACSFADRLQNLGCGFVNIAGADGENDITGLGIFCDDRRDLRDVIDVLHVLVTKAR